MNDKKPIKRATNISHNYENFIAYCPYCDYRNIFNRLEDLKQVRPIAYKEVSCFNQECQETFSIGNDLGDSVYGYLLFDCYELLQEKRYMYCILNITQAYEVFFSTYLRVELLYKPYAKDEIQDQNPYHDHLERLNQLLSKLYHHISDDTFSNLRRIFIHRIVYGEHLNSLDEAEEAIRDIRKCNKDVSNPRIQQHTQEPLTALLQELKRCRIAEKRNQVVHKYAYRPSYHEAKTFFDEAYHIIRQFEYVLDIHDDVNWYCMEEQNRIKSINVE